MGMLGGRRVVGSSGGPSCRSVSSCDWYEVGNFFIHIYEIDCLSNRLYISSTSGTSMDMTTTTTMMMMMMMRGVRSMGDTRDPGNTGKAWRGDID